MSIFNPAERTADETVYCEGVDKLIANKSNTEISNGKPQHAIYLMAKLFSIASSKVRLYSDHLEHTVPITDGLLEESELDIYGNHHVIEKIGMFLRKKNAEVSIVVENDINTIKEHALYKHIHRLIETSQLIGKFEIRKIKDDAKKVLNEVDFENHFVVTDDYAYRYERDSDPLSYKAQANFNNPKTASQLISWFDDFHWKNSDIVFNASNNTVMHAVS